MSKLHKAAEWIQSNMPLGQGETLSVQESSDVSLYINLTIFIAVKIFRFHIYFN